MADSSSSAADGSLSRQHISAGRSNIASPVPSLLYCHSSKGQATPAASAAKDRQRQQQAASLSLATQLNALNSGVSDETRAGAQSPSSPRRSERSKSKRAFLPSIDTTNMTSYTPKGPLSPTPKSGHAKPHKRRSSGSSLPSLPPMGTHGVFNTPFATQEEPFADSGSPSVPVSSTPKLKPYLRKMSGVKDIDQGKLDLSKPVSENEHLAGLGIQDFGNRSVSDVTFAHAGKRGTHARTISVGSQASAASSSRLTQPFIHPMRQTPRPYESLAGSSNASFVDEEEARESLDVVRDDFRPQPFRSNRSMSISSNLAGAPTPLSQSQTVDDLGYVPKFTTWNNESLTNLSIRSGRSSKSRKGRSRRNTEFTMDLPTPSSRTSFDRTFSFAPRLSDTEPQTRDERIREERRKFQEKEAIKDRKREKEAIKRRETEQAKNMKRQERQRRKSEAENRANLTRSLPSADSASKILPSRSNGRDDEKHGVPHAQSYEDSRPSLLLPQHGVEAGMSEKIPRAPSRNSKAASWVRFNAWLQTRMLSCGGQR